MTTCQEVHHGRTERLRLMLEKMKPHLSELGRQASVHLLDCDARHALSLPHGGIYCTVPLFEALPTDDALAFVLAHELGHLENRHGFKFLAKTGALGGGLQAAFKPFVSQAHFQADEMKADLAACYLSHKAGFDPGAAVGLLEKNFRKRTGITTTFSSTWARILRFTTNATRACGLTLKSPTRNI